MGWDERAGEVSAGQGMVHLLRRAETYLVFGNTAMPVKLPPNSICSLICIAVAFCVAPASASPDGDACRKEICDGAVTSCMGSEQQLNPFARTADEKKSYCAQFFD